MEMNLNERGKRGRGKGHRKSFVLSRINLLKRMYSLVARYVERHIVPGIGKHQWTTIFYKGK